MSYKQIIYKNAESANAKEIYAKLSGLESHFASCNYETKSKPIKEELERQISLGLMGKGEEL